MMTIINYTPHEVHEVNSDIKYPAMDKEQAARVTMKTSSTGKVNGIETFASKALPTINLPEPKEGTLFIVSALVLAQHPNRDDLLAPGIVQRDNKGRVISCSGFRRNTK